VLPFSATRKINRIIC